MSSQQGSTSNRNGQLAASEPDPEVRPKVQHRQFTTDPGKELWVTELNWESGDQPRETWTLQVSRTQQICTELASEIATGAIQRYGWWYGGYPYTSTATNLITPSLYTAILSGYNVTPTGQLSPAGQQFIGWPR